MISEGQVGPRPVADGATLPVRLTRDGAVAVLSSHGRYQEAVARGSVFTAATAATGVFTAVGTGATGFILSNPAGSGKNLVLLEILFEFTVPLVQASIVLLYANINPVAAAVVHTAALTVVNALLGAGEAPVGKADSSATLPAAPTAIRFITAAGAGSPVVTVVPPFMKDEVAGAVIIGPGCAVSIQGTTQIAGGAASMTWEEIPV